MRRQISYGNNVLLKKNSLRALTVDDVGIEPTTSSMSTKRSTTELVVR